MDVPIDDIIRSLPSYDERRLLLARDSLASVEGFKMLVMVTYEYLFGMRVCIFFQIATPMQRAAPARIYSAVMRTQKAAYSGGSMRDLLL